MSVKQASTLSKASGVERSLADDIPRKGYLRMEFIVGLVSSKRVYVRFDVWKTAVSTKLDDLRAGVTEKQW